MYLEPIQNVAFWLNVEGKGTFCVLLWFLMSPRKTGKDTIKDRKRERKKSKINRQ